MDWRPQVIKDISTEECWCNTCDWPDDEENNPMARVQGEEITHAKKHVEGTGHEVNITVISRITIAADAAEGGHGQDENPLD